VKQSAADFYHFERAAQEKTPRTAQKRVIIGACSLNFSPSLKLSTVDI
jgi:hypothetical protein